MLFKDFLEESYDIDEKHAYLLAESIATFVLTLLEAGQYEDFQVDKESLNKAVFWLRQNAKLDRKRKFPEEEGNDLDAPDEDILRNAPIAKNTLWTQIVPLLKQYMRRLHPSDPDQQDELTNSLIPRIFNWLTVRKKNRNQPWSNIPADMAEHLLKVSRNELFKVSREQRRQLAPPNFIVRPDGEKDKYGRVAIGGDVTGSYSGGKRRGGRSPGGDSDVHQQMLAASMGYSNDEGGQDIADDPSGGVDLPGTKSSIEAPGAASMIRQERWRLLHDALNAFAKQDEARINSAYVQRWLATYGLTESEAKALAIKFAFGIDPEAGPGESLGNRTIGGEEKELHEFGTANYSILISKKLSSYVRENFKEDAPDINPNTIRSWFNDDAIGLWLQNFLLPKKARTMVAPGMRTDYREKPKNQSPLANYVKRKDRWELRTKDEPAIDMRLPGQKEANPVKLGPGLK